MTKTIRRSCTRRDFLHASGGALTGLGVGTPLLPCGAARPNPAGLKLLASTDGVELPTKDSGHMKFSFSWPEPSVEFGGLLFGFELLSYENTYAIDPAQVSVTRRGDHLTLSAHSFTWAGGQEKVGGHLEVTIKRLPDGALEWSVLSNFHQPVKALKTIVPPAAWAAVESGRPLARSGRPRNDLRIPGSDGRHGDSASSA